MALSERTLTKLRKESEEVGGKVYADDEDALEEDVTHLEEDDDPLTMVGDLDEDGDVDEDDKRLVEWDIDANRPVGQVPDKSEGDDA